MTAVETTPPGFPANLLPHLRRLAIWVGKLALAAAIIILTGILAITAAIAGLAMAAVAVTLRLLGQDRSAIIVQERSEAGTVTLEARQTPRGWTVE
ncbi:MAG: hypothetical protein AAGF20_04180 [Pseudomonadota bacterium]